jgi:uncharacterized membrane protein
MELVRGAILVVTTISLGLITGLFYTFSISVMPTLRGVDDRTFVDVMQRINRDIQNGKFFLSFIGSFLLIILSLVLFIGVPGSVVLPLVVALVFYIGNLVITFGGNIPLNNQLERRGHPDKITDMAGARKAFEVRWHRLNTQRGLCCAAAFIALCWALIQYAK